MFTDEDREILNGIAGEQSRVRKMLAALFEKDEDIMATLQDLQNEVTAETTVDAGLLALINTLVANQNNPTAIAAILANMQANIAPLSAALTANTPAASPGNPNVPPVVAPVAIPQTP
jgi:hypothetical protein